MAGPVPEYGVIASIVPSCLLLNAVLKSNKMDCVEEYATAATLQWHHDNIDSTQQRLQHLMFCDETGSFSSTSPQNCKSVCQKLGEDDVDDESKRRTTSVFFVEDGQFRFLVGTTRRAHTDADSGPVTGVMANTTCIVEVDMIGGPK